ncbi:MAG: peptidylprolyl isomerase [Thermonemataceae bacterium]
MRRGIILWVIGFMYAGALMGQDQRLDEVIVKVDNHIILLSDLELNFAQLVAEERVPNTPQAKCQILQSLVINKLFLAKAEIDSVTVDDQLVELETEERMKQLLAGRDPKILEELYGKPVEALKEELRTSLKEDKIVKRMRSQITSEVSITPSEVKKYFKELDSTIVYKTEVELAQIVRIPEVDQKEKRRIKSKMEDLRKRIVEGGESFEDLARVYCEDGSRNEGGDLGWLSRGRSVPEFEAVVFKLKPDQVSKVIETPFGYHIVKLVGRRGDEYRARHILMMPDWDKVNVLPAKNFLDSLRTEILRASITFQAAATEYSDDRGAMSTNTAANGGFFQQPDGSIRVKTETLDTYVYQAIDRMKEGDISESSSFRTPDGKTAYRILYLKKRYPAHVADLKRDYEKIQAAALADKQSKQLLEWFHEAKKDVYIDIDDRYDQCSILGIQ